ncbi:uncharacterized protein LOC101235754 isoform X1 [Hydra vulgaris]|uniref:uncharacterized protein LOC101235754 isoform X1 n=1 Tax=Hydra vulgaris TaxID=6087 RepID=UPI001F5E5ED1|nr:uncharacterized protein LOC101235754 isoform X1 [Hydra vulgaris]
MQKFSWHQMFFHLFLFAIGAVHTQTFNGSVPIESAILSWTQIFINDNPGLQFLNSNWNFNDFRYYVLQDGLYMKNYSHVYTRIPTLCSGQPNTNAFYNRLNKTLFNISEYENFFEIKYSSNDMIFSDVLNKYFEHYAQQQTCKDLVSAMLPCLCLYPTIINALIPNMDQFDPLVKKWIEFNKSSGTTCKIGQNILVDYGIGDAPPLISFNKSVEFEYAVFELKSPYILSCAGTAKNNFLTYQVLLLLFCILY